MSTWRGDDIDADLRPDRSQRMPRDARHSTPGCGPRWRTSPGHDAIGPIGIGPYFSRKAVQATPTGRLWTVNTGYIGVQLEDLRRPGYTRIVSGILDHEEHESFTEQ